ncbi:uncharacterized protein SAPINGB_P000395 [Magnusiomyces paraingens]|uniref:Pop1 N-terminal domain-containing protein n=1 Tax=Magnusiomyces paraingens TaxID=2606893 RepID=A0A5E8B0A7_9ASCO|nr:uncharacterized protein SAPINGB_P000395 [Saprochaete ingens]VVT44375.1 unnamed protein product [Saprochaete ingens]
MAGTNNSATSRKRAKLRNARQILVQHQDPAIDGGKLNVPEFLRARRFEISQLQSAMLKSRSAASKRAFQALPRSLRRRTASHNVKRMPKRLRDRARYEMLASDSSSSSSSSKTTSKQTLDKIGLVKSKKLRGYLRVKQRALTQSLKAQAKSAAVVPVPTEKAKQTEQAAASAAESTTTPTPTPVLAAPTLKFNKQATNELAAPPPGKTKYAHRQRTKTWLPTHVWHAKRAHLTSLWSFAIPTHPSLKAYRATHRAASRPGVAIAWDASYTASFILEAPDETLLIKTLACVTLGSYAHTDQLANGVRSWQGMAYEPSGAALAPVLVVWEPQQQQQQQQQQQPNTSYKALLRCHPAASVRLVSLLDHLRSLTKFEYHDFRYLLGSIDITGPRSLPALNAIFKLKPGDHKAALWNNIGCFSNSAALPSNVVIALEATDPRLSYPPHYSTTTTNNNNNNTNNNNDNNSSHTDFDPVQLIANWPDKTLVDPATPSIFDSSVINNSYINQPSQKSIDKRRAAATSNSTHLPFTNSDPTFPVLLLKTSPNSWTAIIPWGWVMPTWYSLQHLPGIRLGGLDQRHQLAFESGQLYFPTDYVGCSAALTTIEKEARQIRETWARKPLKKRISYRRALISKSTIDGSTLRVRGEIGSPFRCDWKYLWKIHGGVGDQKDPQDIEVEGLEETCAHQFLEESKKYTPKPNISNIQSFISDSLQAETQQVPHTYATFSNYAQSINTTVDPPTPTPNSPKPLLVTPVKIHCVTRGTPQPNARIYRIPPDQTKLWLASCASPGTPSPTCPDSSYLIGFVTSGAFNLRHASGTGVGAVATYIYNTQVSNKNSMLCLVRNVGSSVTRLAKISQIPLVNAY